MTENSKPLISIVTVSYNSELTIERTIQSIRDQTFSNFEYIVIDGDSKDRTLDIIEKNKDLVNYFVSEPDQGIYDAMNKGIRQCRGEIIGLLNSDDWYEANTLNIIAEEYSKSDGETIFHGLCKLIENGKEGRIISYHHDVLPEFCIMHTTCFVPKKLYEKFGLFDISFKIAGDYEFLLRLFKKGVYFKRLENVLVNFSSGGASSSHASTYEDIRIQYHHNVFGKRRFYLKIFRHSLFYIFHSVVIRPYQKFIVGKRNRKDSQQ